MAKGPLLADHVAGSLPREGRIRRRAEFLRVQRQGVRVHTAAFIVAALAGDQRPRLGVTVSKRVGGSVQRSRVKRMIREVYRRLAYQLAAVDVVVIAKSRALPLAEAGLSDTWQGLASAILRANEQAIRAPRGAA